jgi:serpin B
MNLIENSYAAKVTNVNFITESEKSRQTINNWVEDQTNDKIEGLIPRGALDYMTRLVLTNAIYFKGDWVLKFDKRKTREEDFKISPEKTVKVQMMSLTGEKAKFNYAETENLQIIELPYEGEELSMLILLPKENDLTSVEDSLNAKKLSELKAMLREQKMNVYMPKFTFETKYFMAETLAKMGMPTAFSMDADLSGMDGTKDLFIDKVIHQAFVEVNEEGTEAAAATAVVVGLKGIMSNVFRADHPFIFLIQDRETGNILFLGRVMDPTK